MSSIDVERILSEVHLGDVDLGGREIQGTKQEEPTTWERVDLARILVGIEEGRIERPVPTIGRRDDGIGLFYPGRINGLIGPSGEGKTFVAQHTAALELHAGEHVLFVDFEDDGEAAVERLLALGVPPDTLLARFVYLSPQAPFCDLAAAQIAEIVEATGPSLAVIDSTGEAMAVQGVKPNDDDAVARWFRLLPRLLARAGPAVLLTDHVTKDIDSRGLHAIGSQRKRAAINGAAYMVDATKDFGVGQVGHAKLTTAKDRCGTYVRGRIAAHFHLDASDPARLIARLIPPKTGIEGRPFRPTTLMEKVSKALEAIEDGATLSKAAIEATIKGDNKAKRLALEILVAEGYVGQRRSGNALQQWAIRPYRAVGDPKATTSR